MLISYPLGLDLTPSCESKSWTGYFVHAVKSWAAGVYSRASTHHTDLAVKRAGSFFFPIVLSRIFTRYAVPPAFIP